ncbi:MAG: hypothetical protein M1837_001166 [Sclerophora amabilis]|nr:MAG: hypothetical protein M1837_001166 [Sclerophora amabilis]
MNAQKPISLMNDAKCSRWADLVIQKRPQLLEWISTIHPQKLACQIKGDLFHGSYNLGQKVIFSDGTKWLVRFPLVGHVSPEHADEKVAMEVEAMRFIGERTDIPVPEIKYWGLAAENPLGLGPFVIMDFIEGVSLDGLLSNPDAKQHFRLIREDVSDDIIEVLYRQLAAILLQLFQLDFNRIGSLPTSKTGFRAPIRPLTFKVHDIQQTGGVNTFGDRTKGFLTTTEYFQYVVEQDWEQLLNQPNSIGGESNARTKYESLSALKTLIPNFIHPEYDRGHFKIICDDLSLANVVVRSKDDLTIVGLVDLEWSYVGPAQLFGSAPWWLLGIRLNNVDTYYDKDYPKTAARFLKYLEIFKRVLVEEEERMLGNQGKELSKLVEWSEASGAMWLHMILSCGFNHPENLSFVQLQWHIGTERWERLKGQFSGTEMDTFVEEKVSQLAQYDRDEDKALEFKEDFDNGKMTREQFIAALAAL